MPTRPRPRRHYRPLRWLLGLAVVAALVYAGFFRGGHERAGPSTVLVRTATVTRADVPLSLDAVGSVVALQSVAVRSRVDSQITGVHFKDGAAVKAGQLLFTLDDRALKAEAAQLAANIARDRAQQENAQRQSGRAVALAAKGFATKATRDDSVANARTALATLRASEAALESVRTQLDYTRILAPISGRTGTINVTVGNTVRAGDAQPLVTINQVSPIAVQASLPQSAFAAVRAALDGQGIEAVASVDGEDLAHGHLAYLDNSINQSTGTFATRAEFENPQEKLWPGMFVTLRLILGDERDALTLPEVAVQTGQQESFVYVIADGKAHKRSIGVARTAGGRAVIARGVEAGEVVAIDGLLSLTDGASVRIEADAAPAPTPASAPAQP